MIAGAAVGAAIALGGCVGAALGLGVAMVKAGMDPSGALDAIVMVGVGAAVGAVCGGAAAAQLIA